MVEERKISIRVVTLIAAGMFLLDVAVKAGGWIWGAREEVVLRSQLVDLQISVQAAISVHVLEETRRADALARAIEQARQDITAANKDISWFRAKAGLPPSSSHTPQ